jgi:hypothetical protein
MACNASVSLFAEFTDGDTFSCDMCRGCSYRHYVKTWSFCNGLGGTRFDLNPESSAYCAPCMTACKPGQYVTDLCDGRSMRNTETCADCKACPYGHYHARPLSGSLYPDFYGNKWSQGYTEVRTRARPSSFFFDDRRPYMF